MSHSLNKKAIFSLLLCAFIECYDFLVYGNFGRIFSQMFFSQINNESLSLILSFAIFAIAFFVRPIGSLLFGYIGDKYGRKVSLFVSASMLILSVGGIAFLPTVDSIGVLAPILLVLLRTLQGLSFGGEVGAIVLIAESVSKNKVPALLSLHFALAIIGGATGSFIFKLCYNFIPEVQFYSWGWRIPFIIGLIMSIILPFLRHSIEESRQYLDYTSGKKVSKVPILDIVLRYKKICIITFSLIGAANALFYMFFVFLDVQQQLSIMGYCLLILTMLASGFISFLLFQIYKPENVVFIIQVVFITCVSPAVCFLGLNSVISYFILAVILGLYATPLLSMLVFLLPVSIRQTGFSMCYSIAVAVFGGATPAVCLWLSEITQSSISPIIYLDCCALLSLVGILCLKQHNVKKCEQVMYA
ncbi:MFS transporter [Ehrlichia canis]|uniref:MFS transporter n=1 Tax=Ehrlichia canis TaxID=944 RepID=UPI000C81A104|nr:MFS transporter [Ehrlichia canis]AUO54927.1 MFS transporter [Ehrlichia canis]UKC53190.1 MFS transporter [Ehrlichia canis]UKC54127.1 MFS transporter [Ehrlichia canis]UKC55063.1 MFS transporter [Ehrlichia canis]